MLHEPTRLLIPAVLAVSALGCFGFWVAGRLRKASATVDAALASVGGVFPGSAAHRAALRSVEEGTAPNLMALAGMSTAEQEAVDNASLDLAEQAELDARADAEEAAQSFLETAARTNVLPHP